MRRALVLSTVVSAVLSLACEDARPSVPAPGRDARVGAADGAVDASAMGEDAAADAEAMDDASSMGDAGALEDARALGDALPGDALLADAAPSGACAGPGGFCWLNPRGFGASLAAVSGAADDDVWGVGAGGVIFHRDAVGWSPVASPAAAELRDVHARTRGDVWAVGARGTVLRFDGASWRAIAGAQGDELYAVHARAADDVWIAGARFVHHYDGATLSAVPLPFPYDPEGRAVFAAGAGDVWLGTRFGTLLHYDGATWTYSDSFFHDHAVTDLWGAGPADLWAVSDYGAEVSRWDGRAWSRVRYVPDQTPETIRAVHGSAADDVWLVGQRGLWHFDGRAFTRFDAPVDPNASTAPAGVWASATAVVVVGAAGQVFERRGGAWSLTSGSPRGVYERWFDALTIADDDVWFFGLGVAMRFDGRTLTRINTAQTDYRQDFGAAWAAAPDDVWIAGVGSWGDNVQRWNGVAFSRVDPPGFAGPDWIFDVWGSGPSDVYLAAGADSLRWDGVGFTRLSGVGDAQAVHGTGARDVWMASGTGGGGAVPPAASNGIWHYDGRAWSQSYHDGTWWSSIHALAPDDVWAGGGGGTLVHWDGRAWTVFPVPGFTTADPQNAPFVTALAGARSNDVWAVAGERVLHWDGAGWTVLPALGVPLADVAVAPGGAVFLTGGGDAVLRRP